MKSAQSDYFDIDSHQFSVSNIKNPLPSQFFEMDDLQFSLDLPSGSKIIDFGCGSGRLSIFFLSKGYHVLAVDVSRKSLQNLQTVYRQLHQPGWGNLTVSEDLPNAKFDGLVGSDILHHVNIKAVLPRLYRVLLPGGKIAFSEPNAINIFWYLHFAVKRIPWKIESGILQNTFINLPRLLKINSFKHPQIKGHGLFPTRIFNFLPALCKYNCLNLGNIFFLRPLAYRFIISAEK